MKTAEVRKEAASKAEGLNKQEADGVRKDKKRRTGTKVSAKRKSQKIVKMPSRKRKKKSIAIYIAAGMGAVLGIGMIGGILWYHSFTELDLAGLTEVRLSGFDSKGSAEVMLSATGEYKEFLESVQVTIDQDENLKNGDVLSLSYLYDEETAKRMKIRVEDTAQVVVGGLAEATQISYEQLFEGISVNMEGISPAITVSCENHSEDSYLQTIDFVIKEPKAFYQNGDIITVEAAISEEDAVLHAYDIEKGENGYQKQFVVEGFSQYLQSPDELSEEMLTSIMKDGLSLLTDEKAKEYGLRIFSEAGLMPYWEGKKTFFTWQNARVISCYFNVVTEEAMSLLDTHHNDVKMVYEATLTQPDGVACQAEIVVRYSDLYETADGTVELQLGNGKIISASCRDSSIKKIVHDTDDGNYISTKIDLN